METRGLGWLITLALLAGIGAVLFLNLEPGTGDRGPAAGRTAPKAVDKPEDSTLSRSSQPVGTGAPFREYAIGDEVERELERLQIAAVWFPAVAMEGMTLPDGNDVIHLEADVRALSQNPNGFALGEFVPYMKVRYTIVPIAGGETIQGELVPMVARDGLHYGATVVMPGSGDYRLTYSFEPPSAGGLGRHDDPETGVAPWWKPFEENWLWEYRSVVPDKMPGNGPVQASRSD